MRVKILVTSAIQTPVKGPGGQSLTREVEFNDAKVTVAATINSYLFAGDVVELEDQVASALIKSGRAKQTNEPVAQATQPQAGITKAGPTQVTPASDPASPAKQAAPVGQVQPGGAVTQKPA